MDLRQARAIFHDESREMCDMLEAALLDRARYPDGNETWNLMFRTAHTIKGSAGMFGLEALVRFAHVMENVLERLRSGKLQLGEELVSLLLECNDHLRALLHNSESDEARAGEDLPDTGALLSRLAAYQEAPGSVGEPDAGADRPWLLSLRFHADILREGFDPLAFLNYLAQMGDIRASAIVWRERPPLQTLDATECFFGVDLAYASTVSAEAIQATFEFIEADSRIGIFPPHTPLPRLLDWLRQLNEPRTEVLVRWVTLGIISTADAEALAGGLQAATPAAAGSAAAATAAARNAGARSEGQYIRIEAAKLDRLINRVGELVIAASATTIVARQRGDAELLESVAAINHLVENIRDDALTLRMVPINDIFSRFPRLVREVAQQLGKDIELEILGADTEVDKSMVEKLSDPLLHIVRNALDHGLETPAQRLEAGKEGRGWLVLEAFHEAGSVVVEIRDDGRGIDRNRIYAKAVERGLIADGRVLNEQETLQLIFLPGFSTAETISDLSGRGVGMDVVKRHIEALRGEIDIITRVGEGTTFRLRLPLTLAIIDGFLVEIDSAAMVIPLNMMVECIDLPADALQHHMRQINVRGEWIPYVSLRELFGLDSTDDAQFVVIVNFGDKRAGIVVDRLIGELQAVIKPMGQMFRALRGFSGSTILGNGKPALILDIPQLIHYAGREEKRRIQESSAPKSRIKKHDSQSEGA